MSNDRLIEELQDEHRAILARLESLRVVDVLSHRAAPVLHDAREHLLAHLRKEDESLYPPLREAARSDDDLADRLDAFVGGLETVTQMATEFFQKYDRDDAQPDSPGGCAEFIGDFGRFLHVLRQRIDEEEARLFGDYRRLHAQAPSGE